MSIPNQIAFPNQTIFIDQTSQWVIMIEQDSLIHLGSCLMYSSCLASMAYRVNYYSFPQVIPHRTSFLLFHHRGHDHQLELIL